MLRIALVLSTAVLGATSGTTVKPHHQSDRALAWVVSTKVFRSHARTAFCLAGAETGGTYNPRSVSSTDDHGEWQIHKGLQRFGRRIYNIWFNARKAFDMSHGGTDWGPWTGTYGRGLCHGLG